MALWQPMNTVATQRPEEANGCSARPYNQIVRYQREKEEAMFGESLDFARVLLSGLDSNRYFGFINQGQSRGSFPIVSRDVKRTNGLEMGIW
jgi:hypothetical protein